VNVNVVVDSVPPPVTAIVTVSVVVAAGVSVQVRATPIVPVVGPDSVKPTAVDDAAAVNANNPANPGPWLNGE
jgi:hypothetical protein